MNRESEFTLRGRRVAVLQGGPGVEREVSLNSGAAVLRAMVELGAEGIAVDVRGADFELPAGTDLAFIMVHGTYGEDGGIQAELERRCVPYTGEGIEASRVAFDKILSKEAFQRVGVPTPAWEVIGRDGVVRMAPPVVVKAPRQGSSLGLHIVREASQLPEAIADCLRYDDRVLIEAFFSGRELTVGMLGDKALPVIEIVPKSGFYDYRNKYTKGATDYHVPADLTPREAAAVAETAVRAHAALGLEVYSRVDLLLDGNGEIQVLEVNTIPGMTETSLLPKAAAAADISFAALCERIAALSMAGRAQRA